LIWKVKILILLFTSTKTSSHTLLTWYFQTARMVWDGIVPSFPKQTKKFLMQRENVSFISSCCLELGHEVVQSKMQCTTEPWFYMQTSCTPKIASQQEHLSQNNLYKQAHLIPSGVRNFREGWSI